ncbi:MAG TPA: mechanosensitive ion channel family protein [Acidobacteriaceae bacterium]|nr:mechanosensitive ion channel family protein [Acidobacteriaceae bacterium]
MINCLFFTLGAVPFFHVPVIKRIIDAWSSDFVDLVSHKLPKIVVILIVAFVLYRLVKLVTHRLRWLAKRDPVVKSSRSAQLTTLASIIETAAIGIIAFIAVIHMLQIFHINVAPLLASAGVVGLAIGFGAQTIVHDIINGMLILVENQFDIGDVIKAGGFTGNVEQMSLRRTMLRDGGSGAINIVPNSQITTVTNLSRDWSAIQLDIAVDYREDSDRVLALLRDLAQQIIEDPAFASAIQGNPAILGLDNVKGSQAIYPVVFRTQANMQWNLEREFRLRVKKAFQQNRILPGDGGRIFHYPVIPAATTGVQPKTGS